MDKGSVIVTETDGGTLVAEGKSDNYSLALSKAPTAPVAISVLTDGQTIASSTDSRWDVDQKAIIFTPDNWTPAEIILSIGTLVYEPQPTVKPGIQPQVIEAIRGPLFVYGGVGEGADRTVIGGISLPTERDIALPNISIPEDEDLKTDRLFIFNGGSAAEQAGILTESNLSGFGLGSKDLELVSGTSINPKKTTYAHGITYEQFEIVELMLGQADDELNIHSTALGAITVVHGGGGNDTLRVISAVDGEKAQAGGADRVLVLYGDTSQDGMRYSMRNSIANGQARVFATAGNDIIDATDASGGVIASGAGGNDSITGSVFNDHLLGGSGDDTIEGLMGNDHIYGDNGLRVDLSIRKSLQSQLIQIIISQEPGASDFEAQTGDALAAAGSDTITDAGGDNIILSDFGVIQQVAETNRAFNTAAITTVRSLREDEGGSDKITTGAGRDWIISGAGDDVVKDAAGEGAILADNGIITIDSEQRLAKMLTTASSFGGNDTVTKTGAGAGHIFGGFGSDTVTSDNGSDVILGDVGQLDFADGMRSVLHGWIEDPDYGASDTISSGAGDDWVIGGSGDDVITNESGLSILLGDAGRIEGDADGLYARVETTQTAVGGNDIITGGGDRDIIMGGAGIDVLDGAAGHDMIAGDNALMTREVIAPHTLLTFETEALFDGAADTIIGGSGRDVLLGGTGSDKFSINYSEDIGAGEFARVRIKVRPDASEIITSFLTLAPNSVDSIVQVFLGLNSERRFQPPSVNIGTLDMSRGVDTDLSLGEGDRVDVILLARGFAAAAALQGANNNGAAVPGLAGFSLFTTDQLTEGDLLSTIPADILAETFADQAGEPEANSALPDAQEPQRLAQAEPLRGGLAKGWQMNGWRIAG